jgi:hypothetical protein
LHGCQQLARRLPSRCKLRQPLQLGFRQGDAGGRDLEAILVGNDRGQLQVGDVRHLS